MDSKLDTELLLRWARGDAAAGGELVRRNRGAIHRFLKHRSSDEAEDLVQETFLACVVAARRFRAQASGRTYLIGIALRKLLAHRRRVLRAPVAMPLDLLDPDDVPVPLADTQQLARTESEAAREEALSRAILTLPSDRKHVLDLAYWQNLSRSDIARELRVPPGTVASRLRRAKESLREMLAEPEGESLPTGREPRRSRVERHGRLVLIRLADPLDVEDFSRFVEEAWTAVSASKQRVVGFADVQRLSPMPPRAVDLIRAMLAHHNAQIERSAVLVSGMNDGLGVQLARLVGAAMNDRRQVFESYRAALAYLVEILSLPERRWLGEFMS
jgi:RNA polymerase sigma-70 factor (ECF subfamily)